MKKKGSIKKKSTSKITSKKTKPAKKEIPKKLNYIHTGIKGFDELFEKGHGISEGASVLIEGGPGSGKTIFCLSTVQNLCKQGKKCLFMSFEEPEERLIQHMENFGWPAKKYIEKGLLRIERFNALDVSRSIEALLSAAKKELLIDINPVFFPKDFKPDFVAIDSLSSISSAFTGKENRFRIYMEQLFRHLEKNKMTNFLIREVAAPSHIGTTYKEEGEAVSFLSDGIIAIYNVIYENGTRGSAIEILKMRGTHFKRKIVETEIKPKGGTFVNSKKIISQAKMKARFT